MIARSESNTKKKILTLMGERSIYLLVHSGKSKSLDFGLGPKGRTRNQIEEFFMPELKLVELFAESRRAAVPSVLLCAFWCNFIDIFGGVIKWNFG